MCAEAVLYAVRNDIGRELVVGWSAQKLILGGRLMPGYVERWVAREANEDQESDEPEDPNRPHNLWTAVPGDWAAHGRFDAKAHERSTFWWLRRNRRWMLLAVLLFVLLAVLAIFAGGQQ